MNLLPRSGIDGLKIGLVGPRGLVGEEFLKLSKKKRWAKNLSLISTQPKAAQKMLCQGRLLPIAGYADVATRRERFDLLISLAEPDWSKQNLKKFFGLASWIIDESSAFRQSPDVPLIVPEINGDLLGANPPKLIASPNCTTVVLAMAVAPLTKFSPLVRILAASYQAASGAGRVATQGFQEELRALANGKIKKSGAFPHPLAGNLFPQIGAFGEDGFSDEETKVIKETRKIFNRLDLPISATCVRVPVFRGHSMAVWVELEKSIYNIDLNSFYKDFAGISLFQNSYPTPLSVTGKTGVAVGRLRPDPCLKNGVSLWASGDNLIKGAAENVLGIAELLLPALTKARA